MLKVIAELNQLVRALVSLVVVGLGGTTAYLGYQHYYAPNPEVERQQALVSELREDLDELRAERDSLHGQLELASQQLEQLEVALRLLKVDRRVAHLDVLRQWRDEETDQLRTQFEFVEVDDAGLPLHKPKTMAIDGDMVYVDYLVAKFKDEHVEQGDPLRSTSICLFRRIFGERQQPDQGFVLDKEGAPPAAYSGNRPMSQFEQDIWANFWRYADDPESAEAAGIRAAHGEAVSTRLTPGRRYKIVLRASDGLSISSEALPIDEGDEVL